MMMKNVKFFLFSFTILALVAAAVTSCGEDEPKPEPTVSIFHSLDGYQVAFTLTVTDAESFSWDFGDGETSTEQDPVHVYTQSGEYTATVTVTGPGGTATANVTFTIAASKLEMLTGGPAMANGKTWVFSTTITEGDAIYKDHPNWVVDEPLVDGMLGLIGLPANEYQDEFTFKYDMTYSHSVINDSVVTNTVFALVNQLPFRPAAGSDAVVLTPFTGGTADFAFAEDTTLVLEMTSDDTPNNTWEVTFNNVDMLEIKGGTEFIGVQDYTRQYVIHSIAVDKMRVDMYMSGTDQSKLIYPSHMLRMTFVPKP